MSSYLNVYRACPLKDEEKVEFSNLPTSSKNIILEPMAGNVFISEVYSIMYVVLSKAEKHVPCGEFLGTTE
jgi:hypothetical protein